MLLSLMAPSAVTIGADASPVPEAAEDSEAVADDAPEASADATTEGAAITTFDPASVTLRADLFIDGLATPVYITGDGTGSSCLYVVERGGTVRVVGLDGFLRPRKFLDISALVSEGAEQGLHAIAFHPDFKSNGRFFAHYNDADGWSRIAELKGSPCRSASNKPVKSLLREEQPFPNNNAGWLGFGPDGYLYIPLGDGGGVSPGDPNGIGQSRSSRLSKVLRIDVNVRADKLYTIPKSNPFAKKRRAYPRETWAMGLRDPPGSKSRSGGGDGPIDVRRGRLGDPAENLTRSRGVRRFERFTRAPTSTTRPTLRPGP